MQAFVTGGTGLLGSFLIAELLKNKTEVTAIHRENSDFTVCKTVLSYFFDDVEQAFSSIRWECCDVMDFFRLEEIISNQMYVFHCAAFVSFHKNDHEKIKQINTAGTKNIVQICLDKKVPKLVHVSSIASLGRGLNGKQTTEEDYWDGSGKASVYSKSKFEAEREVWRGIAEGLDAVIVNPSVIIGPGDWKKGSSQLISTVAKGLKFYTKGTNGYVDVRDVAKISYLLACSEISNQRFILNSENLDYKNLFGLMAENLKVKSPEICIGKVLSEISWRVLAVLSFVSGKSPLITRETARSANQKYSYSNEKIRKYLTFEFIPMRESIKFSCEKYLTQITS